MLIKLNGIDGKPRFVDHSKIHYIYENKEGHVVAGGDLYSTPPEEIAKVVNAAQLMLFGNPSARADVAARIQSDPGLADMLPMVLGWAIAFGD